MRRVFLVTAFLCSACCCDAVRAQVRLRTYSSDDEITTRDGSFVLLEVVNGSERPLTVRLPVRIDHSAYERADEIPRTFNGLLARDADADLRLSVRCYVQGRTGITMTDRPVRPEQISVAPGASLLLKVEISSAYFGPGRCYVQAGAENASGTIAVSNARPIEVVGPTGGDRPAERRQ